MNKVPIVAVSAWNIIPSNPAAYIAEIVPTNNPSNKANIGAVKEEW